MLSLVGGARPIHDHGNADQVDVRGDDVHRSERTFATTTAPGAGTPTRMPAKAARIRLKFGSGCKVATKLEGPRATTPTAIYNRSPFRQSATGRLVELPAQVCTAHQRRSALDFAVVHEGYEPTG
jgi:hypothetical protein